MKVRIILKAKEDFGSIKKDSNFTIFNDIFDIKNGIAFFPINKDQWEVVSYDKCSEYKDENDKYIFEKDYVEATCYTKDGKNKIFGSVVFDMSCFCIDIIEIKGGKCGYDVDQKIVFYNFESIKVVSV
jgi:hypothetical protein